MLADEELQNVETKLLFNSRWCTVSPKTVKCHTLALDQKKLGLNNRQRCVSIHKLLRFQI